LKYFAPFFDDDFEFLVCDWIDPIQYCAVTDLNDPTNCLACEEHYFFNKTSRQCELCTNSIRGCSVCNNEGLYCHECFEGYAYDFFENTCYEHNCMDGYLINHFELYDECTRCDNNYYLHEPSGRCYKTCSEISNEYTAAPVGWNKKICVKICPTGYVPITN